MLSCALVVCFTVQLISKKETQGGQLQDLHKKEETMVSEAHCMSISCAELLLINYAKVKKCFHSMTPLNAFHC